MKPTDVLKKQIFNLEIIRDLLTTNDKPIELKPNFIASYIDGVIEEVKYAHNELLDQN